MTSALVVISGASGNLGGQISRELLEQKASVRALFRTGRSSQKKEELSRVGAEVAEVNFSDPASLARACEGAAVVVSALAGLREVIVDAQAQLLTAAVQAGVPRFIPSDFAIDFTRLPAGSNRNLDLRREFQERLDRASIGATSVLNGAFTDMLTGVAPFVLFRIRRVLCWGDEDQLMDWTTIADTAKYTASAALDPSTPRFLRIAGDQISARSLAQTMTEITGRKHKVLRPGGLRLLGVMIKITKLMTPRSSEVYPPWQGMQYMHNMYSGLPKFHRLDNDRYPMRWTTARDVLGRHHERGD